MKRTNIKKIGTEIAASIKDAPLFEEYLFLILLSTLSISAGFGKFATKLQTLEEFKLNYLKISVN